MIITISSLVCLSIPVLAVALAGALGLKHGIVYFNYPRIKLLSKHALGKEFNHEILKISLIWFVFGIIMISSSYLVIGEGLFSIYGILVLNVVVISFIVSKLNRYVMMVTRSD